MNMHKLAKDFENWIKRYSAEGETKIMYNVCYSRYYNSVTEDCWQAYLAAHNTQQAIIDSLMFKYCPDDITPEQLKNWGDSQRRYEEPSMKYPPSDETI